MTQYLITIVQMLRDHLRELRERDDGYSTEALVVTAILTALALFVLGDIIYNKVVNKANGLTF